MTTHNTDNARAMLRALNMMHADGGGVAKIGAELASAGLRPMLIQGLHHGSGDSEKRSLTPAQMGYKDEHAEAVWGGTGGWKLHARTPREWNEMVRRAKQHGKVNRPGLGISLGDGDGQVVCLDADTPAEREALAGAWVVWGGDPKIAETLSETTPGKVDKDGKPRHHGGGHIWAVLPKPVDLSALGGTRLVDAEGNIFKKGDGKGKGTGAALMVTKSYVVVAPTERTEGAYTQTGGAVEAPAGLVARINEKIEEERRGAEEKARRAAERAELPMDLEDGSLAEWSRDTEWAELLTPAGWTQTGRDNTCGCEVWERWGGGSTSRSAVAHEVGCTLSAWEMREGHAPLHIFSTTLAEGDPLLGMFETYGVAQNNNLHKAQVHAALAYPELEPGEAIWAAFQDQGWGDPEDDGIFLQTYEGAVTGGATDIAAVVGLMDDYEAPEAPNEAPVAGVAAENAPHNPAGESAAGGGDVTGAVTEAGTPAGTAAGTQGATQGGTGRTRLSDFMPREEVYPETPECVAFIEEIERKLERPRTPEQRAEAAKLFSLAERNPGLTPGGERDEQWGGVPGWDAGTVVDLMSLNRFTRDVFWWVEDNARGRNPVAVLLLVLLHVGARMPVSVGPVVGRKSLPGPMSMLAILVGESGSGKTGAHEAAKAYCAARGLYDPKDAEDEARHNSPPLGTPQALARKLMVERPTTKPGAREGETVETKEVVMRTNPALVLWDDEMRSLLDGQRESWGTATMITSSWSGQDFLPSTNTGGKVPVTGNYSLFVGGAIQGSSAAGLLESEDLGLLQRAILVPARWPLAGLLDERDIPRPEAPPAADQVAVAEADRVVVNAAMWPGLRKVHRMAVDAIPASETAGTGVSFNRAERWSLPATEDVLNRIAYEGKGSNSEDAGSYGGGGAGGQTLASRARLASLLMVASWSEGQPMSVGGLEWAWASMLMELVTAPTLTYATYKAKAAATRRAEREGEMQAAKNAAVDVAHIERVEAVAGKIATALATKDRVSKSELYLSKLQGGKAWDDAVRRLEYAGECHRDPNARKGSVVLRRGEDPKKVARREAAMARAAAAAGTPAASGTPAGGTAGASVSLLPVQPGATKIAFAG